MIRSKSITNALVKHSPTILSCMASVGVVLTAIAAIKATPKAIALIEEDSEENHDGDPHAYTKKEAIMSCWKCYIPAISIGSATIFFIIGANALNKRKQIALANAYILLDRSYKEYKKKVRDIYGNDTDDNIKESIIEDKYDSDTDLLKNEGTLLFYEEYYGKYFERTIEEVLKAEYELNRKLDKEGEVCLNDFYRLLDLFESEIGDYYGWTRELLYGQPCLFSIGFEHKLITMSDGMECYIIKMLNPPLIDYDALPF